MSAYGRMSAFAGKQTLANDRFILKADVKTETMLGCFDRTHTYELIQYFFGTNVCVCIAERL